MSEIAIVAVPVADDAAQAAVAKAAAGELLTSADLMAIWHIKPSRFYELSKIGTFDRFRVVPAIGPRCYSGALVHRYLNGDPTYATHAHTFGRKRGARP